MKIAIISTYLPQKCGIATFAHDLYNSLQLYSNDDIHIIAVSDGLEREYPIEVSHVIHRDTFENYLNAADFINERYDVCILQHEYGIFGGKTGSYILELCRRLHIPLFSNLHTVSPYPSARERAVLFQLGQLSAQLTVMTHWAVNILQSVYAISGDIISVIPHGVPVFDFDQGAAKEKLGLKGKNVMLSFGFLGRGKGFETAIEAIKDVRVNNFVYIILGVTHPNVLRDEGEQYRETLQERCQALGVADRVKFVNEFANDQMLCDYLTACDIYVTPYPNENQISSGTLSFALGAGAAVVSTPYIYAKDLLADERGQLFDFGHPEQLTAIINRLFETPRLLQEYRNNARAHGKEMSWPNVGKKHFNLLQTVHREQNSIFKRA